MKKNKSKIDKKNYDKYKKYIFVMVLILIVVLILCYYLYSSEASIQTADVTDENRLELSCKKFISFENKLMCTATVTVASNQKISSVSFKLSDLPATIENLVDSSYEANVLNENGYVDVMFANDIVTTNNAIKMELVNITFDNIVEDKLITASDAFFINNNYAIVDNDMYITNPDTSSKLFSFDVKTIPGGASIVQDKYLYIQSISSVTNGEHISDDTNLKSTVENQLKNVVTAVGCTYEVSEDGTYLVVTDDYGNNKSFKIIYVNSINSDYMLPWNSTYNIYTRGYYSLENISKNCLETNGYFVLENDKIKLYGDNSLNDLIDTRNWYYIKSDVYDFTNSVVNITGNVLYEDFMSNIEVHGVSVNLYNESGDEITSGSLQKINTLKISGIPGFSTESITINTGTSDYINISNYSVTNNSDNTFIIYNVDAHTKISQFLNNIDTNGVTKLYDSYGNIISDYSNDYIYISTNMYIDVTLNNENSRYYISVLGDVVGKGTVYLSDVVKLYKIYKNKISFTDAEMLAGDVVNDSTIDLLDVAKLYRYYRGVETNLK